MSLVRNVCRLIAQKGGATVDDLMLHLSEYSRPQVMNAMKNARFMGLIHNLGWANRTGDWSGAGRLPSVYYPGPKPKEPTTPKPYVPPRRIKARPPASVWELGHGLQIAGDWPPPFDGARVYLSPEDNNEE